ncbi:hypothetical protein H257_18012 [Aphanomyces astaci]|uniref:Secreted protein n=1 Tax=Aphanomyces astaci TaxID=112090 RepID=W4FCI9_APHAT|nr:hypothetical protein H257_18012 [Aphanomyces astaci]ETV65180.1 hypothetical protein H257_18012 [Aphanomyces astaci]|eukprot:XP_009845304.1 hypothetical protein H257_18012 [Aphanomyces astaci]
MTVIVSVNFLSMVSIIFKSLADNASSSWTALSPLTLIGKARVVFAVVPPPLAPYSSSSNCTPSSIVLTLPMCRSLAAAGSTPFVKQATNHASGTVIPSAIAYRTSAYSCHVSFARLALEIMSALIVSLVRIGCNPKAPTIRSFSMVYVRSSSFTPLSACEYHLAALPLRRSAISTCWRCSGQAIPFMRPSAAMYRSMLSSHSSTHPRVSGSKSPPPTSRYLRNRSFGS